MKCADPARILLTDFTGIVNTVKLIPFARITYRISGFALYFASLKIFSPKQRKWRWINYLDIIEP